jgi:hypothetical protein
LSTAAPTSTHCQGKQSWTGSQRWTSTSPGYGITALIATTNDGLGIEIHSTAEEFPIDLPFAAVAVASIQNGSKRSEHPVRSPLIATAGEYQLKRFAPELLIRSPG